MDFGRYVLFMFYLITIIFIFEKNARINQIVLHRLKILNLHWSNKCYSLLV